jgi:glycosyltransferase involved in cell wall biosynthesis
MVVVSIIIAVWNRPKLLMRSIPSILAQSFGDFEIIIVGDGMSSEMQDKYEQTIKIFNDNRIRFFNLDKHLSLPWLVAGAPALNYGLELSSGQYIACLDDDDLWLPFHLRECVRPFRQRNVGLVYSQFLEVNEKKRTTYIRGGPIDEVPFKEGTKNSIGHSTVLYRSEYKKIKYSIDPLLGPTDYNMWKTMFTLGIKFRFINRVHALYYQR